MEKPQTWRDVFGTLIADAQERQRIAQAMRVNPVTLQRWSTGISDPRLQRLRQLLDVLPRHKLLRELLIQAYPTLLDNGTRMGEEAAEIPSNFYARVLETYTTSPLILRASTILMLVMQQMFSQLASKQADTAIIIAQCLPLADGKVRSLRAIAGRGTGKWRQVEQHVQLFGIESQLGYAVQSLRPVVTNGQQERARWPVADPDIAQSAVAFPIRFADRVVGGIGILINENQCFSTEYLNLMQNYADLLVFAFEPTAFYPTSQVALGVMPLFLLQWPHLVHFQQRVNEHIIEAMREERFLSRPQVEEIVWHEIEDYLLRLACESVS